MRNERKANKGTKDYLQAAFKITRDFQANKWQDGHPEDIVRDAKSRQTVQGNLSYADIVNMDAQLKVEKD